MENRKYTSFNVALLVPIFFLSAFFGIGFSFMFKYSKSYIIFCSIIGWFIGLLFIKLFLKLMNIYPDLPLDLKIKKLFGKKFSIFLICLFNLSLLLISIASFWRVADFLSTQYLTNTPLILISLLIMCAIYNIVKNNINISLRFAAIIIIISILIFIFNILGLIEFVDINNFKPLKFDFKGDIIAVIYFLSFFCTPIFLITFIPKNKIIDKEKFNKYIYISYLISGIILILIIFFTISSLGLELTYLFKYPSYYVLKKIKFFNFLESIENLTFSIWFLYIIFTTGNCMLFMKNSIKINFKFKNDKIISLFLCFLILIISIKIFEKNYSFYMAAYDIFPFIIPILVLFICLIIIIKEKITFKK